MNSTTNLPRYSIIVPVYNVEDYLPECVDSLLAQDIFPMWLYLAILTLHCACAHSCLQSERKSI